MGDLCNWNSVFKSNTCSAQQQQVAVHTKENVAQVRPIWYVVVIMIDRYEMNTHILDAALVLVCITYDERFFSFFFSVGAGSSECRVVVVSTFDMELLLFL
jgi:hypothetical protein